MKDLPQLYARRMEKLSPYVPGEQPPPGSMTKLNTNENPYPPSPQVREVLANINEADLRLYPDPSSLELREAIAEYERMSPGEVFVSNGSDEALSFCFYAFFDGEDSKKGPLLFPEHTYSFYPVYCGFYGIPFEQTPHHEDYSIDFDYISRNIRRSCGVIFPNPNAPTSLFESLESVEALLQTAGTERAVIVDEAYIDFGGESASGLIGTYDNLAVVKTFSKGFSLAGIRLGYVLGSEKIISALTMVKDSFNSYPVNRITQAVGIAAIHDREYYREINGRIIDTRERFRGDLEKAGFHVLPGKANFLLVRKPDMAGAELFDFLRRNKILVRYFSGKGLDDFVRITIGTDEDMINLTELCRSLG